ncbi:MAG: ChbG/HpnK family deacetylase [bacterium]|nr:ChbG/HpnK family deacetylase [bacterium]
MKIIINGDDFGLRDTINDSIRILAKKGIMKSATILVKRDRFAFEQAVEYAKELAHSMSIGLHLDLDEFFLFDENGCCGNNEDDIVPGYREIIAEKKEAIRKDIAGQIRVLKETGLRISHLDSHHCIHQFLEILEMVVPLMKENGIGRTRFFPGFYQHHENRDLALRLLRENTIISPARFYDLGDIMAARARLEIPPGEIAEIMAHTEVEDHGYGRFAQYNYLLERGLAHGDPVNYYALLTGV